MGLKFSSLDTETITGRARLIGSFDGAVFRYCYPDNFLDCVKFFTWQSNSVLFAFNMDYDAQAIIKWLPETKIEELFIKGACCYHSVKIRFVKDKVFTLTYRKRLFKVFDLFQYYNMSLDKAGEKYIGKRKVKGFDVRKLTIRKLRSKKALEYLEGDCRLCWELGEYIVKTLERNGVKLKNFYSFGYVARKVMRKYYKPKPLPVKPDIEATLRRNYFGGRIECIKRGLFKTLPLYDINSAYPWAMSELLDTNFSKITVNGEIRSPYYFLDGVITLKKGFGFYPLPYKIAGLITYPRLVNVPVVINNFEYDLLREYKMIQFFKVKRVINVNYYREVRPFAKMVEDVYAKRQLGDCEHFVFKIIPNSWYGSFIQKVRSYRRLSVKESHIYFKKMARDNEYLSILACNPKRHDDYFKCPCWKCKELRRKLRMFKSYGMDKRVVDTIDGEYCKATVEHGEFYNIIYASYITSIIRCRVFRLAMLDPEAVVFFATDCVAFDREVPTVTTSSELGGVSLKYKGVNEVVIGSGVYTIEGRVKNRGYDLNLTKERFLKRMDRKRPIVRITSKQNLSLGYVINKRLYNFRDLNKIIDKPKKLNVNFDSKRVWDAPFRSAGQCLAVTMGSIPLTVDSSKVAP